MSTLEQHRALDALVRRVQQALSGEWPSEGGMRHKPVKPSPALSKALEAAVVANDSGIDVEAALKDLQAAWEPSPVAEPEA